MKNINVEENNPELIEYQSTCYEVFTKKILSKSQGKNLLSHF